MVERRIPAFPYSVEDGRIKRLMRGLVLYRLAFGQPRQEDLLEFLVSRSDDDSNPPPHVKISLEPPED